MGLDDDVREAVAQARTETIDLHVNVTHKAWTGQNYLGTATFVSTVRKALVERKQKLVQTLSGTQDMSSHYIAILEEIAPITPLAGYVRTNPVDVNDVFVLGDGTVVTVMAVDGFYDGGTGVPYYSQVYGG